MVASVDWERHAWSPWRKHLDETITFLNFLEQVNGQPDSESLPPCDSPFLSQVATGDDFALVVLTVRIDQLLHAYVHSVPHYDRNGTRNTILRVAYWFDGYHRDTGGWTSLVESMRQTCPWFPYCDLLLTYHVNGVQKLPELAARIEALPVAAQVVDDEHSEADEEEDGKPAAPSEMTRYHQSDGNGETIDVVANSTDEAKDLMKTAIDGKKELLGMEIDGKKEIVGLETDGKKEALAMERENDNNRHQNRMVEMNQQNSARQLELNMELQIKQTELQLQQAKSQQAQQQLYQQEYVEEEEKDEEEAAAPKNKITPSRKKTASSAKAAAAGSSRKRAHVIEPSPASKKKCRRTPVPKSASKFKPVPKSTTKATAADGATTPMPSAGRSDFQHIAEIEGGPEFPNGKQIEGELMGSCPHGCHFVKANKAVLQVDGMRVTYTAYYYRCKCWDLTKKSLGGAPKVYAWLRVVQVPLRGRRYCYEIQRPEKDPDHHFHVNVDGTPSDVKVEGKNEGKKQLF